MRILHLLVEVKKGKGKKHYDEEKKKAIKKAEEAGLKIYKAGY